MLPSVRPRRTWVVAVAIAALVLAALLGFNPLEPGPADDEARAGTVTFHEGGLVFEAPAAWKVYRYENVSSFTSVVAYLATVEVPDPCIRGPNSISCGVGFRLEPGTLAVTITASSFPGGTALDNPQADAVRIEVGGLPGLREAAPPFPGAGADASVEWRFARPGSINNWFLIRADVRGPGEEGLLAAVERMVQSVRFDPPLVPLDRSAVGRATALAAVSRFLDEQAEEDPTWACFPRTEGTRIGEITREPNGPALAAPLAVKCSTAIRPTEFEMWEVTLRIDWGRAGGQAPGRWKALLYGTGDDLGWSLQAESDPFPGAGG